MNKRRRVFLAVLIAVPFILLGCGNDNDGPVSPSSDHVTLIGRVIEIVDAVPVDGGVTITITSQGEDVERLLFPSLHTPTPPSQETINLYDVVRRVEVGDLVQAKGTRTANGVELKSLAILGGTP